ncbi:MAG: tRNA-dihydrouridine synthase [Patescibacteria group bacterium]
MDDVTDTVFRQIIAGTTAPDLFMTEFVNVDGLQSKGREKLLFKLRQGVKEPNLVYQIWGKNPENFYKTTKQIADGSILAEAGSAKGARAVGIDLNFGCPAVASSGACIGMINNRQLVGDIIQATREGAGTLPLSVKTRLGLREIDFTWHEFLLDKKLNMLTIHGRTAKEMSKVPVHWDAVDRIRALRDSLAPNTLLVGNGDVLSRAEGEELAKKHKLDGVMIGRGVFHDPYIFAKKSPWKSMTKQQKIELYRKHVQLFVDTWKNEERKLHTLNKFCKVYINGFDGAKEFREQLMETKSFDELLSLI